MFGSHIHDRGDTSRSRGEQHPQRNQDSRGQDQALNDIRPDDRFDPADQRVENDQDPRAENDPADVPSGERRDGEGDQIEDRADARELRQQETDHAVDPRPRAEAILEVRVGRDFAGAPIERHEPPRRDPRGEWQADSERKRVPVAPERLPRVRDVADAADVRPEDRESDDPTGHRAPAGDEALCRAALAGQQATTRHDADEVGQEDSEIDRVELGGHPVDHRRSSRILTILRDLPPVRLRGLDRNDGLYLMIGFAYGHDRRLERRAIRGPHLLTWPKMLASDRVG